MQVLSLYVLKNDLNNFVLVEEERDGRKEVCVTKVVLLFCCSL